MFQNVLNMCNAENYKKFCAAWHHILFFFLISPIKKIPLSSLFKKSAVKQKRCGNSCFKCSVITKACGRGHVKIIYLATVLGCSLHLSHREVTIFEAVLLQLATVKECVMTSEKIMNAQDGAPSQLHLWMTWYPSTAGTPVSAGTEPVWELLSTQVASKQFRLH